MKLFRISLSSIVTSVVLLLVSLQLSAQVDSLVNLPNLLLPKFTKSVVKLASGQTNTAMLNYNTVDQQMVFLQGKTPMILDNPNQVDTIYMANRTFIPMEKGFYEVLIVGPVTLFKQNKAYVEFEGYPTAYGAKSQTLPSTAVRQIYSASGPVNLKVPDGYKVVDDSQYWVRKLDGMFIFDTKREFLKIFKDKEDDLSKFISKNKINFENTPDVVKLINYTNELYKDQVFR